MQSWYNMVQYCKKDKRNLHSCHTDLLPLSQNDYNKEYIKGGYCHLFLYKLLNKLNEGCMQFRLYIYKINKWGYIMENKIAVIYKSKYGATKRYAGWIALKLDADLYEVSDIRRKDLKAYDTIIYGGPLYIGKIKGIKFIINNYEYIKDKKLSVFMVGMREFDEDYINSILELVKLLTTYLI